MFSSCIPSSWKVVVLILWIFSLLCVCLSVSGYLPWYMNLWMLVGPHLPTLLIHKPLDEHELLDILLSTSCYR